MKQSKIILLLFSLSITVCIYSVFGGLLFNSPKTQKSPTSNTYTENKIPQQNISTETNIQNETINTISSTDEQLTVSTNSTFINTDDTYKADNPHLPIAYAIEQQAINPELEQEEDENDASRPKTLALKEGQSRTYIYSATDIANTNIENDFSSENENEENSENSNNGYFLEPGQSRIFLTAPEESAYLPEEHE